MGIFQKTSFPEKYSDSTVFFALACVHSEGFFSIPNVSQYGCNLLLPIFFVMRSGITGSDTDGRSTRKLLSDCLQDLLMQKPFPFSVYASSIHFHSQL